MEQTNTPKITAKEACKHEAFIATCAGAHTPATPRQLRKFKLHRGKAYHYTTTGEVIK